MGIRLRPLIAVGSVLVTTVMTSMSGTQALWRDAISLNGGVVHAGRLSLVVGDDQTRSSSYAFTTLAAGALGPAAATQAPLTVANAGDARLTYRFAGSTATGSSAVAAAMTLSLTTVASRAACPTGAGAAAPTGPQTTVYAGPLVGSGVPTSRPLAIGSTEVLCVRAALGSSASAGLRGASTGVRLTFTAVSA